MWPFWEQKDPVPVSVLRTFPVLSQRSPGEVGRGLKKRRAAEPGDWERSWRGDCQRENLCSVACRLWTWANHSAFLIIYFLIYERRRQWHPTPVLLPGKFHGWRSLVGCSPWVREESDTTERLHFHFSLYALEKEMATHSSVLAWRIPGTEEPGGLPSMGSHRVGHDWSDLAAAAAVSL